MSATPRDAAARIARCGQRAPEAAIIAGSGLSGIADQLEDGLRLPYEGIPGWPPGSVAGHAGELALGLLAGRPVAVACGRVHLYEGAAPDDVVFGVRVMAALGARLLVVTNAAGGLAPDLAPGDAMVIRDHLFLPGWAGLSPLAGPNDDTLGPRFPVMAGAYDAALRRVALDEVRRLGLGGREGVYAMVAGPSYETPAEARMLRAMGADAVGMSTCPEVVAARHAGLRVLGLSLITNRVRMADDTAVAGDPHAEVTAVGEASAPAIAKIVARVVAAA